MAAYSAQPQGEGLAEVKYSVKRLDDADGKHDDCFLFVLDLTHDRIARHAALRYARRAAALGYTQLASDLLDKLSETAACTTLDIKGDPLL